MEIYIIPLSLPPLSLSLCPQVKESEGVVLAAVDELRVEMTQQIDVKVEETQEQVILCRNDTASITGYR